jgi:hypothetical protein
VVDQVARWLNGDVRSVGLILQFMQGATEQAAPRITKSPPGTAARTSEQDRAAGGRDRRQVELGHGKRATASVTLTHLGASSAVYAYLRLRIAGRDIARYIGVVTAAENRFSALQSAWQHVHERGLLDPEKLCSEARR